VKTKIPKRLAAVGGALLSASGLVNAVLGARIGALVYDAYPGGRMGHVGVIAGLIAIVLGITIVFVVVPLYDRRKRWLLALAGLLTIVIGHAGAIAGAIYVGTLGVILCYAAGIWLLVTAAIGPGDGMTS
jgi:putative copper export protein